MAQIRKLLVAGGAYRWRDMGVCARSMEVYGPVHGERFPPGRHPGVYQPPQRPAGKAAPDHAAGGGGCVTGGFRPGRDVFRA